MDKRIGDNSRRCSQCHKELFDKPWLGCENTQCPLPWNPRMAEKERKRIEAALNKPEPIDWKQRAEAAEHRSAVLAEVEAQKSDALIEGMRMAEDCVEAERCKVGDIIDGYDYTSGLHLATIVIRAEISRLTAGGTTEPGNKKGAEAPQNGPAKD